MDLPVALAAYLLTSAANPALPSVTWQVAPDVSCPTAAQLESELAAHVRSLPESDRPDFQGDVRAEVGRGPQSSTELRVSIANPPLSLERGIASGGRCEEVAHTIAILITAWLLELKQAAEEQAVPPPVVAIPPAEAPPAVTASAAPAHESRSMHLTFELAGGALVGQGSAVFGATAQTEWRISELVGVALQATWLDNVMVYDEVPSGSMQLHRQILAAYAAMAIPPLNRLLHDVVEVRPFLGPVLWHGSAQSYGYETTASEEQWIPGLEAGILANGRLAGPLFVSMQLGVIVLAQSITYDVTHSNGDTATLASFGPWSFQASLGLGVQVF